MNKFRLGLIVLVLLSALPVQADQANHKAIAKKLYRITNQSMDVDKLFPQIMEQMLAPLQKMHPCISDDVVKELSEEVSKVVDFDTLAIEEPVISLYTDLFTEAELQDLLDFYATSTGIKTLKIMPQLMQKSMEVGNALMQEKLPAIISKTKEVLKKHINENKQCKAKKTEKQDLGQ